jgi:hypothetical protein
MTICENWAENLNKELLSNYGRKPSIGMHEWRIGAALTIHRFHDDKKTAPKSRGSGIHLCFLEALNKA